MMVQSNPPIILSREARLENALQLIVSDVLNGCECDPSVGIFDCYYCMAMEILVSPPDAVR